MGERSPQIQENMEEHEEVMATPDVHRVAMEIKRAEENYQKYAANLEEKPSKGEVLCWYLYGLCSYFVHTVLIPIVFPLIISQTVSTPHEPQQGWLKSYRDLNCRKNEMQLYEGLIQRSISVSNKNFSPLEWTSISWFTGLILSAPLLAVVSLHLDYDANPQLIPGVATGLGVIFCLPAGFFRKSWILPVYIAIIVAANTTGAAYHARHLGLMIRGFIGSTITNSRFPDRRVFGSYLSLYSTAAGCLGAAIISSFTYHMLGRDDHFTALWVVSIFSGLKWGVGLVHIFSTNRTSSRAFSSSNSVQKVHALSIFKYPYAVGCLASVFLSSFSTMCIFAGGILYAIGYLCLEQHNILFLWLTYFLVPLLSLPLLHPLQQIMKADAMKMKLLGFLLATLTSGYGFYFHKQNWQIKHLLVFAAVQSTASGLLHAFGRLLWLECSPAGKEGTFSVWFSWVRGLGTCAGFALATAAPGNIGRSFGVAFWAGITGMVILIFANITSLEAAKAAGLVMEDSEKASQAYGWDDGIDMQGSVTIDTPTQGKI
ncbi:major facilitator superfamily domain-containing [Olea europaea subsp. europaea]|uniref:Major facilitator superfamily domain-containing n=1 Tax=Olea europaea subsp. europaea TaxID=158383 RepID=A0A8S0RCN6_OLEEU|nr:major facilitator superfamily domain-containing [Olea europaea subsp. europaea]